MLHVLDCEGVTTGRHGKWRRVSGQNGGYNVEGFGHGCGLLTIGTLESGFFIVSIQTNFSKKANKKCVFRI
jgi:hypothetical protein